LARKALYKHATQVDTNTHPDDGTSPVGSNEWNADPDSQGMLGFAPATATITIASGVATVTDTITVVAAESSTTDTLDKLAIANTSQYDLVYLFADAGDTITLANTSSPSADGQIKTISDSNETLSTTVPTILIRKGNYWYGYGGGVVNAISDVGDVTITSNSAGEILKWSGSAWINQTLAEAGIAAASHSQAASTISDFDTEVANNSAVTANTAKISYSTAASNAVAANTAKTGITSGQASAITANTAKTGITSGQASAITANTAKISLADNAVTLAKMAAGTDGNLITYDTNGDPAYVVTGSATQVLTSNGAGAAPTFQAPAGGGATVVHTFSNNTTTTYTGTASSFGTVGAGDRDIYIKKIDANNEGVFTKIWKNGAAVEVQIA
jgi:hypothetical protein